MVSDVCLAQDLSSTLRLADQTLATGNWEVAETLYRRVAYFDTSAVYEQQSVEGLAYSSLYQKHYDEASGLFMALHQFSGNSAHYYLHILCLLNQEKWMQAKRAVYNIPDTSVNAGISKKVFLGLSEYGLRNFETAEKIFAEVNSTFQRPDDQKSVFRRTAKIDRKNNYVAIALSAVLPGTGQAYTGHFRQGINSLIVNSVFLSIYLYSLSNIGFIDAVITFSPWFHRYYVGGMNSASELVEVYKEEHFLELYNELVRIYGPYIQ